MSRFGDEYETYAAGEEVKVREARAERARQLRAKRLAADRVAAQVAADVGRPYWTAKRVVGVVLIGIAAVWGSVAVFFYVLAAQLGGG